MNYLPSAWKLIFPVTVFLSILTQLRTEQITKGKVGKGDCICTENYDPVCANNGVTYPNSCVLTCDREKDPRILGVCRGECPCCKESFYNEPVEGHHGWGWKRSERWWEPSDITKKAKKDTVENIEQSEMAEENDEKIAGCICTLDYRPVCGTNNKTYGNACALQCEKRKSPCLQEACKGECPCCSCNT